MIQRKQRDWVTSPLEQRSVETIYDKQQRELTSGSEDQVLQVDTCSDA